MTRNCRAHKWLAGVCAAKTSETLAMRDVQVRKVRWFGLRHRHVFPGLLLHLYHNSCISATYMPD